MTPTTPVLPSQPQLTEITFAKNQPQYQPLPAIRLSDGTVITRWKLNWKERLMILLMGNLYLQQLTFNSRLQPQLPQVTEPEVVMEHR